MNDNILKYMELAIKESKKALKLNEVPIGAIIVKDNVIVGKGYNKKEISNDATKHAEIIALQKAYKKTGNWRLNDSIMFTTLFPCPMCASAIQQSRIRIVYYLNDSTNSENKALSMKILSVLPSVRVIKVDINNFNNEISKFFNNIR